MSQHSPVISSATSSTTSQPSSSIQSRSNHGTITQGDRGEHAAPESQLSFAKHESYGFTPPETSVPPVEPLSADTSHVSHRADPYTCLHPGCAKRFAHTSDLERHVENHFRIDCPERWCGRVGMMGFIRESHLDGHLSKVHSIGNVAAYMQQVEKQYRGPLHNFPPQDLFLQHFSQQPYPPQLPRPHISPPQHPHSQMFPPQQLSSQPQDIGAAHFSKQDRDLSQSHYLPHHLPLRGFPTQRLYSQQLPMEQLSSQQSPPQHLPSQRIRSQQFDPQDFPPPSPPPEANPNPSQEGGSFQHVDSILVRDSMQEQRPLDLKSRLDNAKWIRRSRLARTFLPLIYKLALWYDGDSSDASIGSEEQYGRSLRIERLVHKREMKNRLAAAMVGGSSLIVPMLIMAIDPSRVKTLVTASVAVLLFSLGLAWKSTAKTEALLGTTAAYAAVMVVFVGVSSNQRYQ